MSTSSLNKSLWKKSDGFDFFLEPNARMVIVFENLVLLKIDDIEVDKDETYLS